MLGNYTTINGNYQQGKFYSISLYCSQATHLEWLQFHESNYNCGKMIRIPGVLLHTEERLVLKGTGEDFLRIRFLSWLETNNLTWLWLFVSIEFVPKMYPPSQIVSFPGIDMPTWQTRNQYSHANHFYWCCLSLKSFSETFLVKKCSQDKRINSKQQISL